MRRYGDQTTAARATRQRLVRFASAIVATGYLAVAFLIPTRSGLSISTRSGVMESCCVYELPFTGIVVRRTSTESATQVSAVLAKHGTRQGGPSSFVLAHESNGPLFGFSCAIGSGGHCMAAVQNPTIASFLDAMLTYATPAEADGWVGRILSPDTSRAALSAVITSDLPDGGFADRAHFAVWWQTAGPKMEDAFAGF